MSDAKIGTIVINEEAARGAGHPPVIVTRAVKPAQGVLPAGLLLQNSPSGLIPWNPAQEGGPAAVAGVLDVACDTATQASCLSIIHGSVRLPCLKVGAVAQAAPDETAQAALLTAGLYPE